MKSVTEFISFKLIKGIESKTALTAEGKTPEEISASLGEAFKLEGEKLQLFMNCIDVAAENLEQLARIRVINFAEGEMIPPKAVKVEDNYYVPEFIKGPGKVGEKKSADDGKKGKGKGKRKDGPRSSPWGISPEEAAAKKAASKKNQPKAEKS